MSPHPTTAPARLHLLLPWLNGHFAIEHFSGRNPEPVAVFTDYAEIRRTIATFVKSFDGSAGAGYLEVIEDTGKITDGQLGELESRLSILLEQGFGDKSMSILRFPTTSLAFAVRSAGRQTPSRRKGTHSIVGGVQALRDYRAAGAYVLRVQGNTLELVPFLAAHLLTQPGMVAVRRCQRLGCPHFVITATAARGAPQKFCSQSCGKLNAEQQTRRRK